jgi:type IV secretion system protein VirD4
MGTGILGRKRSLIFLSSVVFFTTSTLLWHYVLSQWFSLITATLLVACSTFLVCLLLYLRIYLPRASWLRVWLLASPWLVGSLFVFPFIPLFPYLPLMFLNWCLLGLWGNVRFYPLLGSDTGLHTARFADMDELEQLLTHNLLSNSLLLGVRNAGFVTVQPTATRAELGNLLIVAPTRGGKGLLAVSQLLSWQHSVVVNDIKGELFAATAGYRSTLGDVYVIDPTGIGHCYDPLLGKNSEDEFYSSASHLLFQADEGDGRIFTERATVMLTQLFLASRLEKVASLLYARFLIRLGLADTVARLNQVDPQLATQFLDVNFAQANLTDRFLVSSWGTLTARMRPLLTETVVRSLTRSDFTPEQFLCSDKPVSVYIRWKEQDLLALSPLVRLLWGSLINELTTTYDTKHGEGCHPVLLLIDEAGRTAIPMLADQATTVVGRGISLWIAIQSLSQLETVYGRARAQVLRDNMESQIYYRPTDIATARYLEDRLGSRSAYARSTTSKEGLETSEGRAERPIPLLAAQDIAKLADEEIIGFHRNLPPMRLHRCDWRKHSVLQKRRHIPSPELPTLPKLTDLQINQESRSETLFPTGYIDPERGADRLN